MTDPTAIVRQAPPPQAETTADPWPELPQDELPRRPRTRGECIGAVRPCPWVSCRHHLLGLEDNSFLNPRSAALQADPDDLAEKALNLPQTCALDVADQGQHKLEQVGDLLRVSRERIRQNEVRALIEFGEGWEEMG